MSAATFRVELGATRDVDEVARWAIKHGFSGSPRPDTFARRLLRPWAADNVSENLGFAFRSFTLESRGETTCRGCPAVGEAHGVAERTPRSTWVEIVDIVPQVMLRTIQRARTRRGRRPRAPARRSSRGASRAPGT